ncbi:MAG: glycosyltransferase family 9 protein [Ignavibacteria bacterium]|nr:glycosyltransferase family 9 protein [Ignavibacteria bacterium]
MEKILKILVIRFSSFGDIVLTYPFLNEIRRLYPQARIDYLVKKQYIGTIQLHTAVDNVFILSENSKNRLKAEKYDVVFNLQGNPRSILLSLKLGRKILKVRKDTFKKLLLVYLKINTLQNSLPVFAKYLMTLRAINPEAGTDYTVTNKLRTAEFDNNFGEYAVVSPSSKHFTKRMPADKFIDILKSLNTKIILTGDNNEIDTEICGYISRNISNSDNFCGKLTFAELAAYIRKSKFIICNDSGILHLAEALNKKVFVFFGSSVKEFGFYPQLKSTEIFDSGELNCRPCSHIGKSKCIKGHFKCMNDIDIEAVKKRIHKYEHENIS